MRVYSEQPGGRKTDAAGEPLIVPPAALLPEYDSHRAGRSAVRCRVRRARARRRSVCAQRGGPDRSDKNSARGALVRIVTTTEPPAPPGAPGVRVEGEDKAYPIALDGDAYLTGLAARNRAVATWLDHRCGFEFDYPDTRSAAAAGSVRMPDGALMARGGNAAVCGRRWKARLALSLGCNANACFLPAHGPPTIVPIVTATGTRSAPITR